MNRKRVEKMEGRSCLVQILLACFTLAVLGGLGSRCSREPPRPGDPAVYARMKASTDCAALRWDYAQAQAGLQRAASARHVGERARLHALGYMQAADERMRELGCYKQ